MSRRDELAAGDVIAGSYRVEAQLGSGLSGRVYRVRHTFTARVSALKVMHEASDAESLEKLQSEARMLANSGATMHIVPVLDAGQLPDGRVWFSMEYVQGRTLRALLADQGHLSLPLALQYAEHIAIALDHAHNVGVVHRDLKPDNVMIRAEDNSAHIIDFGNGKFLEGRNRTTAPPERSGTPAYMSPEQIAGHGSDLRMDIYSLGISLWEMLTGTHPFQEHLAYECRMALALDHLHRELPALAVPEYVNAFILKSTDKDPARRYQYMAAALRELREMRQQLAEDMAQGRVFVSRPFGEPMTVDPPTSGLGFTTPGAGGGRSSRLARPTGLRLQVVLLACFVLAVVALSVVGVSGIDVTTSLVAGVPGIPSAAAAAAAATAADAAPLMPVTAVATTTAAAASMAASTAASPTGALTPLPTSVPPSTTPLGKASAGATALRLPRYRPPPASAPPASAQPASAQPASASPASAPPASALPASAPPAPAPTVASHRLFDSEK